VATHTPTSWRVNDRRGAPLPNIQIIDEHGHEIAQVSDVHMRDDLCSNWTPADADAMDEKGLAYAHLIAAAPTLLRVLTTIAEIAEDRIRNGEGGDWFTVEAEARAAITRSEGGQS
jgi:hypothetical protein